MSARLHAVAARHVFDGATLRDNAAVLIEDDRIAAVVPRRDLSAAIPVQELPQDAWLAPGFIDIQVNGGGDVLFNDAPTPEALRTMLRAHRKFGTTSMLPTLISDSREKMTAALAAVEGLLSSEPGLLGVHLEGPFLSPDKAGVHDPAMLRRPEAADLALLTARRKGVTLVTLAPEVVPPEFIAKLTAAGVRVALGHSMATYAQTRTAMAEGASAFTHLFNAMRPLDSREPGPIAVALERPDAWYGLIVDGVHVAAPMLRLALRGAGKPILVTDAMPPVGGTRSSFALNGETIVVREDCCRRADGRLAGAYLDMIGAVRNCVRLLQLPLADALRLASAHPAEFLGVGHRLGKLAAGFRADMVALDGATIEILESWAGGVATSRVGD